MEAKLWHLYTNIYTHTQELDLRHIADLTSIVWLFTQGPLLSLTAEYGSWGGEWCLGRRRSPLSNLTLGHAREHGRNLAFLATSTEEDLPRPGVSVITTRFSGERYHHYPHIRLSYEHPSTYTCIYTGNVQASHRSTSSSPAALLVKPRRLQTLAFPRKIEQPAPCRRLGRWHPRLWAI